MMHYHEPVFGINSLFGLLLMITVEVTVKVEILNGCLSFRFGLLSRSNSLGSLALHDRLSRSSELSNVWS